uniref:uncharacterized protein LOC113475014 n=1 Tax=Ciona intestinalis TaxID=7719 RepID=UPI000EF4D8A1|nr:uncharacterized protein LOC113475014 [Ciona intestinalis]|eukprot:XP_026694209.1 uncharacterized protein LOC113475014 [Ciona intestinalis]
MKGHASKSFKPNEVNRSTTPSGSVSFFIPQERQRSAAYRSIMGAKSEGALNETKTREEITREKLATDSSPDTSEFETASEISNPEPCTSGVQKLNDGTSITEIKADDVTPLSPSLSREFPTNVETEVNVKNNDPSTLENPPTSPIEDSELPKSYTDYEDDFESCSDSDDEVQANPRTPACWGVLSRSNVMCYDEWRQRCDHANRYYGCGPQLGEYEVDYSLRIHRMKCQYFSAFYPLLEKRLKFVGGAFSNTCSPIQEDDFPEEDEDEDKDSTKSSSPLPISPPLLPPKRKKLRKITPQRKATSDPGPYIESDESDTDSYDFSLVAQKATTPPPSPSPHFVFLPRRCGKVSPMPHCSKTEVIVVVTSSYEDDDHDDHDDAQNNGCGCCHLLRKMGKRIKKLFK